MSFLHTREMNQLWTRSVEGEEGVHYIYTWEDSTMKPPNTEIRGSRRGATGK
jgi:hypothetical protein